MIRYYRNRAELSTLTPPPFLPCFGCNPMTRTISPFAEIRQRAAERKGGDKELAALVSEGIKPPDLLAEVDDSRYLSAMTCAVFKAGFVWQIIDYKWAGFEQAFWHFNVLCCAMMSPDDFDTLCEDERIVRNSQKIRTVPLNATMILDVQKSHGSFGQFLATWPQDDFVGLLEFLAKNGSRLGGNSGQHFLRAMGMDGFVLSRDGIAALIGVGVVDQPPKGKRAMKKVQEAYNQWRAESGWGYAQISRTLAMSVDS